METRKISVMSQEELSEYLRKQFEDMVKQYVEGLLRIIDYNDSTHVGMDLSRVVSNMEHRSQSKMEEIVLKKVEESGEPKEKIYALLAFYHTRKLLVYRDTHGEAFRDLIELIRDEKITLQYGNNIFVHFLHHHFDYLRQPFEYQNNFLRKKFQPDNYSPDWLNAVSSVQEIMEGKLRQAVDALADPAAKLALLEKAKEMPVFKERTSNSVIGAFFSRKTSLQTIDEMIAKTRLLNSVPELKG